MKSKNEFKADFLLEREESRALRFFIALMISCFVDFLAILTGLVGLGGWKMAIGEMDIWGFSVMLILVVLMGGGLMLMYLDRAWTDMMHPINMAKKGQPVKRDFWGNLIVD